jgi:magnesium chelatase accessory protein
LSGRRRPEWTVEGIGWPHREASRFVTLGAQTWHVQVMGAGPVLLLLHGTGAATHSWRGLMPLLARDFTVVAPDLPGHGFSNDRIGGGLSLPRIAAALGRLLRAMDLSPAALAGHSAGAAIGLRMTLDQSIAPRALVSINGALAPFPGVGAVIFPAMAKLLFANPFTAAVLSRFVVDRPAVARMIAGTGSALDETGLDCYYRLLRTERHLQAALGMMAHWDLRPLQAELRRLAPPLTLVAAEGDRAVPPRVAAETQKRVPRARLVRVPGLGHLAHEEAPRQFAEIIRDACLPSEPCPTVVSSPPSGEADREAVEG